jgi:hypothetical protein
MPNKSITIEGCFVNCPYKQEESGMGYCEDYTMCRRMGILILCHDNWEASKWYFKDHLKFHPNCPLQDSNKEGDKK